MRTTSARRAGTPRGRVAPPTDIGMGSPPAKRSAARVNAEVPPAPSREMSMQEVTHTLQHLMAQAAHDTLWIDNTQMAMEDHAKLIDLNAGKSKMLNQIGHQLRSDLNQSMTLIESNDIAIKDWSTTRFQKIEGVIEELHGRLLVDDRA